jgi:hypothetical protein
MLKSKDCSCFLVCGLWELYWNCKIAKRWRGSF